MSNVHQISIVCQASPLSPCDHQRDHCHVHPLALSGVIIAGPPPFGTQSCCRSQVLTYQSWWVCTIDHDRVLSYKLAPEGGFLSWSVITQLALFLSVYLNHGPTTENTTQPLSLGVTSAQPSDRPLFRFQWQVNINYEIVVFFINLLRCKTSPISAEIDSRLEVATFYWMNHVN